jgi:hypothetical protein
MVAGPSSRVEPHRALGAVGGGRSAATRAADLSLPDGRVKAPARSGPTPWGLPVSSQATGVDREGPSRPSEASGAGRRPVFPRKTDAQAADDRLAVLVRLPAQVAAAAGRLALRSPQSSRQGIQLHPISAAPGSPGRIVRTVRSVRGRHCCGKSTPQSRTIAAR